MAAVGDMAKQNEMHKVIRLIRCLRPFEILGHIMWKA